MAKTNKEDAAVEDDVLGALPTGEELASQLKDYWLHKSDMDAARAEIGSLVKNGEDGKNIHRKAFKQVSSIEKMDVSKRSEYLRHLFHYLGLRDLLPHPDLFEGNDKVVDFVKKVRRDTKTLDQMEAAH